MLPSDHEAAAAKHHVVPAAAAVLSEAVVGSTPQAAEVVVHQDHDSEVVDVAERRVVGVVACYLSPRESRCDSILYSYFLFIFFPLRINNPWLIKGFEN